MSTFYAIKREDKGSNDCPYWKGQNTWTGGQLDAERYSTPYSAEAVRENLKTEGKKTWVVAIQVIEQEVKLTAQPVPTTRPAFSA